MRRWTVPMAIAIVMTACSTSDADPSVDVTSGGVATTALTTTVPTTTVLEATVLETTVPEASGSATSVSQTSVVTTVDSTDGRPFDVIVPSSYDGSTAVPLVVLLHGYTASGDLQEDYFKLRPRAEERGFLYVHPDGTKDLRGEQFWNATDACCDLADVGVDDSAYLAHVIEQIQADYNVDPKRIFLIGHSNGGFMSYRMACDHADLIAGIVSVSGATFADPAQCRPSQPVSVLEIHGTSDAVISYDGGEILGDPYPSAPTSVSTWSTYNGCGDLGDEQAQHLDLEGTSDDEETAVVAYDDCPSSGAVELWTVNGGAHSPEISSTFFDDVLDFLYAHPKA